MQSAQVSGQGQLQPVAGQLQPVMPVCGMPQLNNGNFNGAQSSTPKVCGLSPVGQGQSSVRSSTPQVSIGGYSPNQGLAVVGQGYNQGYNQGLMNFNQGGQGLMSLNQGSQGLNQGLMSLNQDGQGLNQGGQGLNQGLMNFNQGGQGLNQGLMNLNQGFSQGGQSLNQGFSQGAQGLNQGLMNLNQGAQGLNQGLMNLNQGAQGLNQGLVSLSQGAQGLNQGLMSLGQGQSQSLQNFAQGQSLQNFAQGAQGLKQVANFALPVTSSGGIQLPTIGTSNGASYPAVLSTPRPPTNSAYLPYVQFSSPTTSASSSGPRIGGYSPRTTTTTTQLGSTSPKKQTGSTSPKKRSFGGWLFSF